MTASGIPPVAGLVVLEARDASGALVHREARRNAYTLLAAAEHAKALAGEPASLLLTHIGVGPGGMVIDQCESAAGWVGATATATLDTAVYRQGLSSIRADLAASSSGSIAHSAAIVDGDASAGSLELFMRLNYRGRADLGASRLVVYTTGGGRLDCTLAAIEAANSAFVDGTWALVRIPRGSFTVGAGSPDWHHVTGVGLLLASTSAGALQVWVDDVRVYTAPDVTSGASAVPMEASRKALSTLTRSGRAVTADAFWTTAEAVGQFYMAGLYAGSVLVSAVSFPYYKAAGLTLRVTWTLTTSGG
jgi:hypothetical protein